MKPPEIHIPPLEQWPADEISRLAGASGKPLEVACAEAFLGSDWEAWLGSHFDDDRRVRELDVLVEKTTNVPAAHPMGTRCTSRILVSCKGFPRHLAPLSYSVSRDTVSVLDPALLASEAALTGWPPAGRPGILADIEAEAPLKLLESLGLQMAPRSVGFDTIEARSGRDGTLTFARANDGDRPIYGAIDSAVKAARYWNSLTPTGWGGDAQPLVFLHVPVCLLSVPIWDVCIDGGRVGEATVRRMAFQTNHYPGQQMSTLLATADSLSELIGALDVLHRWLCALVVTRFPNQARDPGVVVT